MPLTPKGEKIMSGMQEEYGPDKGKEVFYASKNAGTIKGVDGYPSQSNEEIIPERQKDLLGEPSNPHYSPRGPLGDAKSKDQSSDPVMNASGTPVTTPGAPMNNLGMGIPTPNPAPNISSQPSSTSSTSTTGDALRSMNARHRAFWAGRRR